MLDMHRLLLILNLLRHCHSHQADYQPTANDSEVVSTSEESILEIAMCMEPYDNSNDLSS